VSTLSELLAEHTELPGGTVEHLQRVVAEWQLLADMSFADFLLWIPLDDAPERLAYKSEKEIAQTAVSRLAQES